MSRRTTIALVVAVHAVACDTGPVDPPGVEGERSVVVTPTEASIHPSESLALSATVVDADGEPIPGATVTWSVSNEAVARVEADGLEALLVPEWFGDIEVIASSEGAEGRADVTIRSYQMKLEPDTGTVMGGDTIHLTAWYDAYPESFWSARTVASWVSSDTTVARVRASDEGGVYGPATGIVTAVGPGTAEITAVAAPMLSASATITVEAGALTIGSDRSFFHMPANTRWDGQNHLAAIAVPSGMATSAVALVVQEGDTAPYGGVVTWTSSAPGVVSVDDSGNLTAHAPGTATVSAAAQGFAPTSIDVVAVSGYTATPLGFNGTALSDAGAVVGRDDSGAVFWQAGVTTHLGDWYPEDVNSAGTVVGTLGPETSVPVVWLDGALSELDMGGCAWGEARAINETGAIGGWVWCDGEHPPIRTRRWTAAGMDSVGDGFPEDMNAAGVMVGWEGPSPRLWAESQLDVPHPDYQTLSYSEYWLMGINDGGALVGFAMGGSSAPYSYGISVTPAGEVAFHDGSPWCSFWPDAGPSMRFHGINNEGVIVGRRSLPPCDATRDAYDGIVMQPGLPPIPLRLLTPAILTAGTVDVNNAGQILATDHLLTPIPF